MTDNPHAAAIVALASGQGVLDVVDAELTTVARAVAGNRDLYDSLTDIHTPAGQRLRFVESEALAAAHPTTRAALAMVIAGEAAGDLSAIADGVSSEAAARRDAQVAEVTVAAPMDEATQERLRSALERSTGKKLTLKVTVDDSVVGGVRARIGDTVIDGSLAGRLADVRTRLAG